MFVEVFSDKGSKVTFYTIRKEDAAIFETEAFFRNVHNSDYKEDVYKLTRLLSHTIANKYGAYDKYFNRHEQEATALPPKKFAAFKNEKIVSFAYSPLRLYALKVSDSIVILFNGGLKFTKGSAQNDPNVSIHFYQANEYAKKIREAIREGMIIVEDKTMTDFQGNTEILI